MSLPHGTVVWNELNTHDVEKAKKFYGDLLGWEFITTESTNDYIVATRNGEMVAGIVDLTNTDCDDDVPSYWFPYIEVENIDAATGQVLETGGKLLRPIFEVPTVGRIAIILDNTGACLGLMQSSDE